jgi:hypothetical protein
MMVPPICGSRISCKARAERSMRVSCRQWQATGSTHAWDRINAAHAQSGGGIALFKARQFRSPAKRSGNIRNGDQLRHQSDRGYRLHDRPQRLRVGDTDP